ncbi:hypothetical protein QZH41_013404 [Actinostola sp. cb2023]|nr:hypothetical protein QZH41_013404 [Actinostola sp. cb2023]
MKEFKTCTIDPIWDLREDLQFWLGENRERLLIGEVDKEHSDVLEVVSSVKMQQKSVMDKLNHEQHQLEEELESFSHNHMIVMPSLCEVKTIKTGIPVEALELDCPDETLQQSVLEEFNLLDRKYQAHLEYLSVKYDDAVGYPLGGWSKQDHFQFVCIMDQYPPEMPNRRYLYIDRMLKELPHKGRSQLVRVFREQKLEVLQLQAAITARQAEQEKELLQAAQAKEKHRRERIKDKVKVFEEQKMKEREEAVFKEKLRLEELEAEMAEQAILDMERVRFRDEKLKEKEEMRKQAVQETMDAEQEKERRLAKLREQVEVHVDVDPERVFRATQATQARFASIYDEELELQKPLFTVHGYEDRKVSSDPRLKVEQALRNAGLHQTEYARKIMATVQPPQQPRKDQQSTVFKYVQEYYVQNIHIIIGNNVSN